MPTALIAIDTDGDGLDGSVETNTGIYVSPTNTGTNPNNPDSDVDGARGDWYEVAIMDKNPLLAQPNAPNNAAIKANIPYPLPHSLKRLFHCQRGPDTVSGQSHFILKM